MDTLPHQQSLIQALPHTVVSDNNNLFHHKVLKVSLLALLISVSLANNVRAEDYPETVISDDPDAPRVFLNGDTITVTDRDDSAIRAENGGDVTVQDGGITINTTGTGTVDPFYNNVIIVGNGSEVDLGTGTIITASGKELGIMLYGDSDDSVPRPNLKARDLTIVSANNASQGIDSSGVGAYQRSNAELIGNTTISTPGVAGGALITASSDSHITFENGELSLGDTDNPAQGTVYGIASQIGSSVIGSGTTTIQYSGSGNFFGVVTGARYQGGDAARVVLNDLSLQAVSDGGTVNNLWATQSATIDITGNAVLDSQGASSSYLAKADRNGAINLAGSSTATITAGTAWGAYGAGLGTLTFNKSQLSVNGTDAAAVIRADNSSIAGENRFTFTDSELTSNKDGILVTGGDANVSLTNTSLSAEEGAVINATGGGTTNVTAADHSQLTGRAVTAQDSTSNLTLSGGSAWTVTGDSSLSSLTLDDGVLRYASDATVTTTNPVTLSSNGGALDTGANAIVFSYALAGEGALTKAGSGTLTLTGASTYTGGTVISEGTLALGNGDSAGEITGNITNNGVLVVNNNGVQEINNGITGTGQFRQEGTGTTILTGEKNWTGGTVINQGTLQLGNGDSTGEIAGNITNNAVLTINNNNVQELNNAITGTGQFRQEGTGTTILTGEKSWTGGTVINQGTLQLGNGDSAGEIAGNITNNAALTINNNNGQELNNVITGTGQFRQEGKGTTILTGENNWTGGTLINQGTLQLGKGGTQGSLTGDITNNSELVVDRSDALTLNGAISGTGKLRKQGSGELILSGLYSLADGTYVDSGALTFSGNTVTTNIIGQRGAVLNLKNNATLNGWVDPLDMNIESGSTWNLAGAAGQNVLNTLTLAGNINFPTATSGNFTPTTLTINNLEGQNGTVALNADLSNNTADRIIIDGGSATGGTQLAVNNVSSTGEPTQGNGILLVEATNGGTTATDAFQLSKPVYAGAYRYSLLRGADDGSAADNWYLSSNQLLTPSLPGGQPVDSGVPAWRPGVSVAAATPLIVAGTNMALMSNFYERTGFYGLNNNNVTPKATAPCADDLTMWCTSESRAWGRYINDNITHKGDGSGVYGDAGAKYSQHINAIQLGNDFWRNTDDAGNRNYAGLYATIGNSRSHVTDYDGDEAGLSRLDAYTLGSYFTYVHNNDAWTDLVLQGSWLKTKNQAEDDTRYDTEGFAIATSLEGGYPVYEANGWKVEPHAGVVYQYENLNDVDDGITEIRFNDFQSLQGSAGIRVSNIGLMNNLKYSVWLDAGAGQEFMGKSETEFAMKDKTDTFTTRTRGGFGDVKVGGSLDLNKTLAVYTSANWTPRFDNTEYSLGASVGVRGTW